MVLELTGVFRQPLKKYSIENECFEDEVEAKKAEALLAA